MYHEFYAQLKTLMDARLVSLTATPILEVSLLRLAKVEVEKEAPLIMQFGPLNPQKMYFTYTPLSPAAHKKIYAYLLQLDPATATIEQEGAACYACAVDKLAPKLFAQLDTLLETEWAMYQEETQKSTHHTKAVPMRYRAPLLIQLNALEDYCRDKLANPSLGTNLCQFKEIIKNPHTTFLQMTLWLSLLTESLQQNALSQHLLVKHCLDTFKHFFSQIPAQIEYHSFNFLIPLAEEVGRVEERNKPRPGLLGSLWGSAATSPHPAAGENKPLTRGEPVTMTITTPLKTL